MCNLYQAKKPAAEIAALFSAQIPTPFNAADETVPGWPGMVVREQAGERILQSMTWGFPLPQKSKRTGLPIKPLPVNNVADVTKPMWRGIAPKPHWRCLIPVTAFAEAEGEKGRKTRTWFRVKGEAVFAWAGFWRESIEWGSVYTGLMTDCNEAIRPIHDRMPVLLMRHEYDQWLHGTIEDVVGFQSRGFPDDLIEIERTSEPWLKASGEAAAALL
ncbi:SOS response-associated peptidase [Sphingobium sp. BS19]|uniref:SOS response-associated peptidase n=1 Tax=Sphingobium sp. BS19 TaxID=3018973 RepID=UPI0022ED4AAF|nr:SOS response-associated peptidase family protein [Sphingobium sp. BS19]GLI97035.1 DUF159 family protein [Sphingobium sp. BS19]